MNKTLHTTLVFLLCSSIFYAQGFPITDQGNRWSVEVSQFCGDLPDCNDFEITGYRVNGEEVVNGNTYAIIEFYNTFTNQWQFSSYLRQEGDLVYIFRPNQEQESLLYDFSLEVGDASTLLVIEDTNQNGVADVTAVTTEFIAGEMRKVITFDVPTLDSTISEFEQWIEGIGSTTNLILPFQSVVDASYNLGCFGNGVELYPFSEIEDCSLLNTDSFISTTSSLTPNPISEQSQLTIDQFQGNTSISFYNLLGQLIDQKEVTNNTMAINRSDFPSTGIYFYQIEQNGVITDTQKFIVK